MQSTRLVYSFICHRRLLHTGLPLMKQENAKQYDEQPHMRIEAKATKENKGVGCKDFSLSNHNSFFNYLDPYNYMMHHKIYSEKELKQIKITHKKFESWHDRVAYAAVQTLRFVFDRFTGYIHEPIGSTDKEGVEKQRPKNAMTEKQWLRRIIFLESIAGVPGMVAGMSRHMKSLRKFIGEDLISYMKICSKRHNAT